MPERLRLTLVIASLTGNGAERVISILANEWAARGHEVTLITLSSQAEDRQRVQPNVHRVALDVMSYSGTLGQAIRSNFRRVTRLRREIRLSRPDAVVSFLSETNVLTLAATRKTRIPVIVSERIDPTEHRIPVMWASLRRVLYPQAAAIVVQTAGIARWAEGLVPADRVHTIPNPVQPPDGVDVAKEVSTIRADWLPPSRPMVFAMGRLTRQKGFDVLLRAFAHCHPHNPEWSLAILGEGEERGRLEALSAELGIDSLVHLPGHVPNPSRLLRSASLFVLPSRYEGFPNALLEAMSCRLPVIATDCPSGPREIVRDGVDGVLVRPNDVMDLAAGLHRLMRASAERERLGSRAVDVVERFSLNRIMERWDDVLGACADTCRRGKRQFTSADQVRQCLP